MHLRYKSFSPVLFIISLFFIILSGTKVFSATAYIDAVGFTFSETSVTLEGSVTIKYKDSLAYADRAIAYLNDEDDVSYAQLFGNVIYKFEKHTLQASEMTINFEKDDSFFINSYAVEKYKTKNKNEVNVKIWSANTNKPIDKDYIISKDVKITTCQDCVTYFLIANKVTVYPDKFLIARNVVMTLFNVPVFYFPFYFQNLSEEDKSPFKVDIKYENDKIGVGVNINNVFENKSFLNYKQVFTNDLKNHKLTQTSSFKYGMPIGPGNLFLNAELTDTSFNKFETAYEFITKATPSATEVSKLSYTYQPASSAETLYFYIPTYVTPYGELRNITSFLNWTNRNFNNATFLKLNSQAFQLKYKTSSISLSSLKIDLSSTESNVPIDKAWQSKRASVGLDGKYYFYSGETSLSGKYSYNLSAIKNELKTDTFDIKNLLLNQIKLFSFRNGPFYLNSGLKTTVEFDYINMLRVPAQKTYLSKTQLEGAVAPSLNAELWIFNFGLKALELKKVLVNSYTPASTDSFSYNDYIGYKLSLFDGFLYSSMRFDRQFELKDILQDTAMSNIYLFPQRVFSRITDNSSLTALSVETENSLNLFGTSNNLKTVTKMDLSDKNNFYPDLTNIKLTAKFNFGFTHLSEMDYKHSRDELDRLRESFQNFDIFTMPQKLYDFLKPHSTFVTNTETLNFNRNYLSSKYKLYFGKESFQDMIPESLTEYAFYIYGNKIFGKLETKDKSNYIDFTLKFLEQNSVYSFGIGLNYNVKNEYLKSTFILESFDQKEFLTATMTYDLENNILDITSLKLQKKIICWTVYSDIYFKMIPDFQIKEMNIKFFINDIPEKNIEAGTKGIKFNMF